MADRSTMRPPAAAPPASKPDAKTLLTLSTFTEHDTVIIDERAYNIRNTDEMSLIAVSRAARIGKRLAAFGSKTLDDLNDEEAAELEQAVSAVIDLILDAPPEVVARLSFTHKYAIAAAFFAKRRPDLLGRGAAATPTTPTSPMTRAGTRSSRGSRGPTPARRRVTG